MNVKTNTNNIALVDMDGTIADYEGAMQKGLEKALANLNVTGKDVWKHEYKPIQNLIKNQIGFWKDLRPLEDGMAIVNALKFYGFTPHILTKGPYKTLIAWTEKAEWCRKHLPAVPVTISEDKGLVYGKILVDDWPPYCESWLTWRPRGLVIMPAYPYNEGFDKKFPGQVIRYTGNNWEDIKKALELVASRQPGEPLITK